MEGPNRKYVNKTCPNHSTKYVSRKTCCQEICNLNYMIQQLNRISIPGILNVALATNHKLHTLNSSKQDKTKLKPITTPDQVEEITQTYRNYQ